jgi:hypothetical protein
MATNGDTTLINNASAPRRLTWRAVALEQEILSVLDAKPRPDESHELAFRRKEAELIGLFDGLGVADAMERHRRLSLALPDDPIASRFGRLIAERRSRLLSFLAGARRRAALRGAR